jgi:mRNA interferase MazF
VGSEVKKTRPAGILSNDVQNRYSGRVLAAPVTSNISRVYPFEAEISVGGRRCKAMLDQIRCLDQSRLSGSLVGVSESEMTLLEDALRIAFDLT